MEGNVFPVERNHQMNNDSGKERIASSSCSSIVQTDSMLRFGLVFCHTGANREGVAAIIALVYVQTWLNAGLEFEGQNDHFSMSLL